MKHLPSFLLPLLLALSAAMLLTALHHFAAKASFAHYGPSAAATAATSTL